MKLPTLLANYLYNNHRLDLPGIGTFTLDPASINTTENNKERSTVLEGVSFKSNPALQESPDLVTFISSQTGKMKALANADLGSYLQLAQQFLNISKPFIFEGIGTLIMKKPGEFEFKPATVPLDKLKDNKADETSSMCLNEHAGEYNSFLDKPKTKIEWKRPIIALLALAGVALAIWGGYTISKRAAINNNTADIKKVEENIQSVAGVDTTARSLAIQQAPDTANKNYKYVLQVGNEQRILQRYKQLKTNLWDVHMETKDSMQYKLFILLPALNADTTHIVDSLTNWLGRKVFIDHSN